MHRFKLAGTWALACLSDKAAFIWLRGQTGKAVLAFTSGFLLSCLAERYGGHQNSSVALFSDELHKSRGLGGSSARLRLAG